MRKPISTGEKCFRLRGVLGDDEGLKVHAEDGGTGGIERERSGHGGIVAQKLGDNSLDAMFHWMQELQLALATSLC